MKLLSLKCLILFAVLFFPGGINNIHFSHERNEVGEFTNNHLITSASPEKNCLNLELGQSNSKPINQGEKVEPTIIGSTYSNHSEFRFFNLSVLQKLVFLKEDYFLSSPYTLLISQTFCISTLIKILRI